MGHNFFSWIDPTVTKSGSSWNQHIYDVLASGTIISMTSGNSYKWSYDLGHHVNTPLELTLHHFL